MTGFGRGEALCESSRLRFRVEISSVNRKQLELKTSLPREMIPWEGEIRQKVGSRVSRGALQLRAEVLSEKGTLLVPELRICRENLQKIRQELAACQLPESALQSILLVPGVLEQLQNDLATEENKAALLLACDRAVDQLLFMRETEGAMLAKDFAARIDALETMLLSALPYTEKLPLLQKEKLLKKLEDSNLPLDVNDERILREIVIFTDKLDVTEEVTRLKSHFAHFRSFLANKEEQLGRNMDFLTQEIFREINTFGNKATCPEVSPIVVRMKTEAEKIREQVQNVE